MDVLVEKHELQIFITELASYGSLWPSTTAN